MATQRTQKRPRPRVVLVTPALAALNNGNWQTAARWSRFLRPHADVDVCQVWDGRPADLMIALHARRSAESIQAFAATGRAVVVVLTGTDLYRDIRSDPSAQQSLRLAKRLVVLQAQGLEELDADFRAKTTVIYQSAPSLKRKPPRLRSFDLLLVAHLRAEKDPLTAVRALHRLSDPRLRLLQIGDSRDPDLGAAFVGAAERDGRIRQLGALAHATTRQWISRAQLLLLPSIMEGGANVLIEAVTAGVPVLASHIPGSIGMLGADYPGYFPVGDDQALAGLIERCKHDSAFLRSLAQACTKRAPLFAPAREAHGVQKLLAWAHQEPVMAR